ncbi:MAG TPA: AbiV family abortive infection protein [Candidatus Limnocylindrales bacterium]|nr:AbiV family abortive infection protein [Candidatus Limnocylindrales bacterium]
MDEPLRKRLLGTAKLARDNASELLREAKLLLSDTAFARAGVLAIFSEEESSKSFILSVSARDGRWDSVLYEGLRDHGSKQAISQAMIQYAEIIVRSVVEQAKTAPLAAIASVASLLNDKQKITELGLKAMKQMQDGKQRDRLRQRFQYVAVDKSGFAPSRPETTKREDAEVCIAAAEMALKIADIGIDPIKNSL